MWIADQWQDYELLDCGGGEKLERWGKQYPGAPGPAGHLGDAARGRELETGADARYHRSPDRRRTLGEENAAGELAGAL